jgi:hypothetical protein
VGRNVIDPSIANPTMKARATHTLKTEERNSRSGSTGSTARRSTNTKITRDTSDPAIIQMIVEDPHGYSVPPRTAPG